METLFYVGLIFVLGALTKWVSLIVHLPTVVGYLILGLLIGPAMLGIVSQDFVENSTIITDLALAVIAVLIGSTLKISEIKYQAKEVTLITLFQSVTSFLFVTLGFMLIDGLFELSSHEVFLIAIFLGAIATATAPAASMAVVHEMHAKGKFTSTFLAVIAADDAISLIMFSLALTVGVTIIGHGELGWHHLLDSFILITLSTVLGVMAALINTKFENLFNNKAMETISTLGFIFIVYSLSEHWHLEPLLSAMVMGIVMVNTSPDFDIVEKEIDNHLIGIIYMLFFVVSAMHLNFDALFTLPVVISIYVLLRFFGKYFGSYIGALISGSDKSTRNYIGLALLPQAGVAIGLALSLQKDPNFITIAPMILNIVIATTLVYEIVGPLFTKFAIEQTKKKRKKYN